MFPSAPEDTSMDHPALTNDLAATLESGGVALGLLDNTYSLTLVEFYGELDLDFVWMSNMVGRIRGTRI